MTNKEHTYVDIKNICNEMRVNRRFVSPNCSFCDILGNIPNIQRTQKRSRIVYMIEYETELQQRLTRSIANKYRHIKQIYVLVAIYVGKMFSCFTTDCISVYIQNAVSIYHQHLSVTIKHSIRSHDENKQIFVLNFFSNYCIVYLCG